MTGGAGTELSTKNMSFEGSQMLEPILAETVARRVFNVFTVLPIEDQNYTYEELLNDIGTKYDFDPYEMGRNTIALKETLVPIPLIYHDVKYTKLQIKRRNKTNAPVSTLIKQMARVFRKDEDSIAFAGEATKTGVVGFDDSANSTAATVPLSLSTTDLLDSTLNGIINQLNVNLNGGGGNQTVKQFPCMAIMNTKIENRLWTIKDSVTKENGYFMFKRILLERCGPGSEIIVTQALGGTVTRVDDRNSLAASSTGTGAAFGLMAKSPNHQGIVASTIEKEEYWVGSGWTQEFMERWRTLYFTALTQIYCENITIT